MSVTENRHADGVVEIVLSPDGDTGPAFTTAQVRQLHDLIVAGHTDGRLATVIRQSGDDFCLGRVPDADEHGEPAIYELLASTTEAWAALPGITVAAARGRVQGFGCGFVMQSDISVVADDTVLRVPEIEASFAPAIVAAWIVKRTSWQTVAPWLLTAAPVPAADAHRLGLVSQLTPAPQVDATADAILDKLRTLHPGALAECKRFGRAAQELPAALWVQTAVDSLVRQHVEKVEAGAA